MSETTPLTAQGNVETNTRSEDSSSNISSSWVIITQRLLISS